MFRTKEAIFNFIYSIGAAIVIIGALFKMTHWHLGPLGGNFFLAVGLITEAIIFTVFAFDPPKSEEKYAWENVYPELLDAHAQPKARNIQQFNTTEVETNLSEKLDKMLAEAKIDSALFDRLRVGMDKFSDTVERINKTTDVTSATAKYNEQLNLAATHLESMNALYALQLEHGRAQSEYSKKYVEDLEKSAEQSAKFNQELTSLTNNVGNLNRVYGGMLNAMKA